MPELSVAIVAADNEQRAILQVMVEGTSVAHVVYSCANFPAVAADPVVRRLQSSNPNVILVDIPAENSIPALRSIELFQQEVPNCALFAVGSLSHPQVIVGAMRSGAREFMERPTTTTDLLEAFVRLTATQRKQEPEGNRGKVFSVMNAKGGSGATTLAVNLALALQAGNMEGVALVDMAPLGHAALHLNVKPLFGVGDAIANLHRMDSSLLESFMTRHPGGLQLLAGDNQPQAAEISSTEFAHLSDMLVNHYRYIVVDLSSRIDATARLAASLSRMVLLVAHADVASMWSASRVKQYLSESGVREQVVLVLNRFRKIAGFSEADAEAAAGLKLFWKIPNQYFAVSSAIDRGVPLMQQNHTEIARSFQGLAARLTENDIDVKRSAWSLFKTV